MNNVALVEVVYCVQHLTNGLRRIFLCELSIVTDSVEQLSAGCQLGDNVEFILHSVSFELTYFVRVESYL